MRNRFIFILFILLMLFLITACGGQTDKATNSIIKKNEIPEPYKLALEDIKNHDYDSAYRYLELTIKDFPDSNYLSNAYFLKSIIDCSSLYNVVQITSNLVQGLENGITFYNKEEFHQMENYIETIKIEIDNKKNIFKEEVILVNNAVDNNDVILSDFSINEINYDSREPFAFFKKMGIPIPTESEFTSEKQRGEKLVITNSFNNIIKNDNVDYVQYYNNVLIVSNLIGLDEDFMKQTSSIIMTLTENDKYNKIRLDTEEFMKKKNLN